MQYKFDNRSTKNRPLLVLRELESTELFVPPSSLGSFGMVVTTTPKSIRNSLNPSVYLAQDNSEIRYKLLMFSQEGAARAANGLIHDGVIVYSVPPQNVPRDIIHW